MSERKMQPFLFAFSCIVLSWNRKEVPLKKDRSYFLEALLVQNDGDYHLSVGVKFPDGSYSRPVSKEYLVKYTPGTLPGNANKDAEGCTKGKRLSSHDCVLHSQAV